MFMEIKIGKKIIGDNYPVFIIAEAGVNHNGDVKLAKKLVDAAVASGSDAVKFQTFNTDVLIRQNAPKAGYQDINIGKEKSQYQMLKELELKEQDITELKEYAEGKGIIFLSTAYDFFGVELLEKLEVPLHKLASIDVVFHPLIQKIARTGKPLILSSGMATEEEIDGAVAAFRSVGGRPEHLILLQCNTNYPANPADQNLRAMETLKKYAPCVGYSDHTQGNEVSIAAAALGARVIEKHLTLDKTMAGPDHSSSMNPDEFKNFVQAIRKTEAALGKKEKRPTGGELENMVGMRRSICAKTDIPAGTILTEEHLSYKRPGDGLVPTEKNLSALVGKTAKCNILKDENITFDKVK